MNEICKHFTACGLSISIIIIITHTFLAIFEILKNSQVKTVVKKKDSSKALPKIQEKKVKLKKDGATEKQSNYITSTSIDQEICIHIA